MIITAENHIKLVLAHSQLLPDLAIIDACLTLGVPPHVTAMTGIDALTHAIEAYVASNVTPLTQALALRAISMISHALPIAVGQGHDIKAREDMMLASYMAGWRSPMPVWGCAMRWRIRLARHTTFRTARRTPSCCRR